MVSERNSKIGRKFTSTDSWCFAPTARIVPHCMLVTYYGTVPQMLKVRAVSFDLFNTVIHIQPERDRIQIEVLADHGISVDPMRIRRALVTMDGLGRPFGVPDDRKDDPLEYWSHYERELLRHAGIELDDDESRKIAEDCLRVEPRLELYEDVAPAVSELRRRGLTTAIVSNLEQPLDRFLPDINFPSMFDVIVTSGEVGAAKPDARIFLEACRRLKLQPENVLHIGDQIDGDVNGAQQAGLQAILLDRSRLAADRPDNDHAVAGLIELLELLPS